MRKRLLMAAVFMAVGLAVALPLGDRLGLSPASALLTCGAGGAFLGYVVSIFLDIFLPSGHSTEMEN